jgi:hypothetical protein
MIFRPTLFLIYIFWSNMRIEAVWFLKFILSLHFPWLTVYQCPVPIVIPRLVCMVTLHDNKILIFFRIHFEYFCRYMVHIACTLCKL